MPAPHHTRRKESTTEMGEFDMPQYLPLEWRLSLSRHGWTVRASVATDAGPSNPVPHELASRLQQAIRIVMDTWDKTGGDVTDRTALPARSYGLLDAGQPDDEEDADRG